MRRIAFLSMVVLSLPSVTFAQLTPEMKFNEVRELAPGVFFRYSSISATDKTVPFGGSNHAWVVFEDYVLVFDANFPKEAKDVIAAIRKTTDKPIRYVVDSHHHGDHAYGNAEFAKAGASIIAQANCARLLRTKGPEEFAEAGRGPMGRKDVAASTLKVPDLIFDDKLVLEDSQQRVEILFFGHAHTAGDTFLYLPKHKILCTGDACTNGAFNYAGHADTASWIRVLDKAQQLDVKIICPGHGHPAGKELLKKQRRYFVELRQQVRKGVDAGKTVEDIIPTIDMPWHKEWTGMEARERVENITYVYDEMVGRVMPWDLVEDFGIYEGPSPTKESKGWAKPKRILVPKLMPARLLELKRIAPEVQFVPVEDEEAAAKEVADADAVIGFVSPDIVKNGKKLRWVGLGHAGVDGDLFPALVKSDIVLTNTQRLYGPNVADQAMALLLTLTRGLNYNMHAPRSESPKSTALWLSLQEDLEARFQELHGKTVAIVGLGGIGTQIARRAHGFGMNVMAVDPNEAIEKPSFVFSISRPAQLEKVIAQADVVVLACPLTNDTRGMFGAKQFAAMKKGAYFVNIARGGLVKTPDLLDALNKNHIAGAGLDVTDPEPLPDNHVLWRMKNVVVSPHIGGASQGARDRQWRIYRENLRRFVAGEPLLCVVNKERGF